MAKDDTTKHGTEPMRDAVMRDLRPMGVHSRGGPTPEMLAKANATIDKMTQDFPNWASKDVDKLDALLAQVASGDADPAMIKDVYKLAHDMRGQGGSFGYPVVTGVAGSFCKFVNSLDEIDQGAIEILQAHVKALRAVLQNKIAGDGGPVGAKIQDGLDRAVARYNEKRAEG